MIFGIGGKKFKMKRAKLKIKKEEGFTLIELLVAMATFVVVVVTITSTFLMGMGGSKRVFGQQDIQEAGRFIMESMSKELRMSKINTPASADLSSVVNITNSKDQTLEYSFYIDSNNNKIISRNGEPLSSNEIEVTGGFYIQRENPDSQPRVTIVMVLKNKTDKAGEQSELNLQTTVSSRSYVK